MVKHSYSLKKFHNCRGGFTNKDTEDPLILNNEPVNDRNVKKDYVFAEKKSLGDDSDYLLDCWNNAGNFPIFVCLSFVHLLLILYSFVLMV